MAKIQLGVIFGSRSCEREVSIISAIQLMNHVNTDVYDVIPVYISETGIWYTGNKLRDIRTFQHFQPDQNGIERVILDTTAGSGALLATHGKKGLFTHQEQVVAARMEVCLIVMHGLNGEDGTLQGLLELCNIPYSSTGVAGSAIGMDKIMMKQFFRGADLPVLPGTWYTRTHWRDAREAVLDDIEKELGYPVFVKPANLGSSIGVSRAGDRGELEDALDLAYEYDRRVLVEKGLDEPMELNCSVLGYDEDVTASPIEMPVVSAHHMLDFQEKYLHNGGSKGMATLKRKIPADISAEQEELIRKTAVDAFRYLGCNGVTRIDFMIDMSTDKVYINEINTIPGSLAFYLWEPKGVKYPQLLERMIQLALKRHRQNSKLNYTFDTNILSMGGSFGSKGSKR